MCQKITRDQDIVVQRCCATRTGWITHDTDVCYLPVRVRSKNPLHHPTTGVTLNGFPGRFTGPGACWRRCHSKLSLTCPSHMALSAARWRGRFLHAATQAVSGIKKGVRRIDSAAIGVRWSPDAILPEALHRFLSKSFEDNPAWGLIHKGERNFDKSGMSGLGGWWHGGREVLIYQLIKGVEKTVVAQFENKLQPLSPELWGLVDGGREWAVY